MITSIIRTIIDYKDILVGCSALHHQSIIKLVHLVSFLNYLIKKNYYLVCSVNSNDCCNYQPISNIKESSSISSLASLKSFTSNCVKKNLLTNSEKSNKNSLNCVWNPSFLVHKRSNSLNSIETNVKKHKSKNSLNIQLSPVNENQSTLLFVKKVYTANEMDRRPASLMSNFFRKSTGNDEDNNSRNSNVDATTSSSCWSSRYFFFFILKI